jgi:hypothetical protein
MRNIKVLIQADTTQAIGKVRELTGALAQLDAAAKQGAENAVKALNGANPAALNPADVNNQAQMAAQAQGQTKPPKKVKTEQDKAAEANKKRMEKLQKEAEKNFKEFADDIGKVFGDAFEGLFEGGLKGALKGFKDSLKSMLQGILKQLIGNIASQIKTAISKKIVSIFSKNLGTGTGTGTGDKSSASGDADNGTKSGVPGNIIPGVGNSGLGAGAAGKVDPQTVKDIVGGGDKPVAGPVETNTSGTKTGTGGSAGKAGKQTAANALGGPGKFQTQIASMLPGIGMSLGGMLGFGSSGASMLGQVGGLLAGGIGMAFLAPGLLTSAFGGTIAGVGGATASAGLGGAIAGLLTNPFTIAAAGALIIGAIIWGITSRRRREEKQRNQAMLDAFSQLDELLKQVNSDQIDGASAVNQANQIRKQYVDQMSQLKDGKTRRIALADVSRIDARIAQIKQAGEQQTARKALDAKLVPTFADGGKVGAAGYKVLGGDGAFMRPFNGRVPGVYDRKDDFLARLSGNEVVLTPDVWLPIAPYLKQKRVPGFADGGRVDGNFNSSFTGSGQTSSNQEIVIEELTIYLSNQFGAESAARIVDIGLKTPGGQQAVVKSVRTHIGENGLGDGLVRDINNVNERGF